MAPNGLTRVYCNGVLEAEGFPIAQVSEQLERPDAVVWVDLCAPTAEQLAELAGELGLHELAVEDVLEANQRPKVDRYESHLFLAVYSLRVDVEAGRLDETEVAILVNSRWIVTISKDDGFPIEAVVAEWDRSPHLAARGVGYFLYGLLDVIVDQYFDAIEAFDDYYDTVTEGIFAEHPIPASDQRHWFEMRRALVRFHRQVVPTREAVSNLMRHDAGPVDDELYPYFQDVYDHILRVTESTEALRDLVATIVETNLGLRDYRQNLVVKKVSSWAAIVAVPSLLTGYYGMNVPYPGSGETSGVITSTGLMVAIGAALYVLFRRRDWL